MDNLERNWFVFTLWLLFAILLTLFFHFRRGSLRRRDRKEYWPPGMYPSMRRRLKRRYRKTLLVSAAIALMSAVIWCFTAAPQ
jgi:hypothetical protein